MRQTGRSINKAIREQKQYKNDRERKEYKETMKVI